MATIESFQVVKIPISSRKWCFSRHYFSFASATVMGLLVYVNTSLAFNDIGLLGQLVAVLTLIVLWFGLVGFRLQSSIFASIALMPSTMGWGVGYLKFPSIALTLSDLFMVITFCMFLVKPVFMYHTKYTNLIWLLFGVCFASVLFAENPIDHMGQLVRLLLLTALISIVLASQANFLKLSVFYGMLFWPLVALSNLKGVESLWQFFSFSEGGAFNFGEASDVLVGSQVVVLNIIFLLPLFLLLKFTRLFTLILLTWIIVLAVFSNSRSLSIGISTGLFLYMLFMINGKQKIIKFVLAGLLASALILGVASLGYFNFTIDKGSKAQSSYVRITKMMAALNTFMENPVLGIGYGAANAIDTNRTASAVSISNPNFFDEVTDVKASAEFTPSQILAETGLLGGLICLFLLAFSFKRALLVLKKPENPIVLKIFLLSAIVYFVTFFLCGNFFNSLVFMLAVPFILDGLELKNMVKKRSDSRFEIN